MIDTAEYSLWLDNSRTFTFALAGYNDKIYHHENSHFTINIDTSHGALELE